MRFRISFVPAVVVLAFVSSLLAATGSVSLEIVGDSQFGAAMSFQQWNQSLAAGGVRNFRLRSANEGDKAGIEVGGTAENPTYRVTALLNAKDELVVPGARFRRSECKKLAEWLDDLAKRGPPDKRERTSAFGLTATQLDKVNTDLSKAIGFSTQGMTRAEAVRKIAGQLGHSLKVDGELTDGDDKIEEELSELSSGTALACILRPAGFSLVPCETGGRLSYNVAKAKLDQELWPIGWPAESVPKVLPGLYEYHNVSITNVPADKVLQAVSKQVKAPVLYDHNALARHDIEPAKAMVSHPNQRTTYSIALRKMLSKAGLKFEVRVDEAGKPFLWVSTVKPV